MIDLAALRRIAKGDPNSKITVRRAWLAAVLEELEELESVRESAQMVKSPLHDLMGDLKKTFGL